MQNRSVKEIFGKKFEQPYLASAARLWTALASFFLFLSWKSRR